MAMIPFCGLIHANNMSSKKTQRGQKRRIDLSQHDQQAVRTMLHYLYTFLLPDWRDLRLKYGGDFSERSKLFIMADKYAIPGLRSFAKFNLCAVFKEDHSALVRAMQAYPHIPAITGRNLLDWIEQQVINFLMLVYEEDDGPLVELWGYSAQILAEAPALLKTPMFVQCVKDRINLLHMLMVWDVRYDDARSLGVAMEKVAELLQVRRIRECRRSDHRIAEHEQYRPCRTRNA